VRRGCIRLLLTAMLVWLSACGGPLRQFEATAAEAGPNYAQLLSKYVDDDGRVDYQRWHRSAADIEALDAHLAERTGASPESHPKRFPTRAARLSYWLNLYNALVVREILRNWPIASVNDVRPGALSFIKQGKGFFYDVTFRIGGREVNLLDIENEIIRGRYKDARIHFALNCGSTSCPALPRSDFDDVALGRQLDQAAAEFINDPTNLTVDTERRVVRLSKIFDWYREEFETYAAAHNDKGDATVIDFLSIYATGALAQDLKAARGYDLEFQEYDWALNDQAAAPSRPTRDFTAEASSGPGVGSPLPELHTPLLLGGEWRSEVLKGKVVLIDFWATWCKPCRESLGAVQKLAKAHEGELAVIAISVDEPAAVLRDFLAGSGKSIGIGPELVALDPDGKLAERLGVQQLPADIVVDRSGIVRYRHDGLEPGEIDALIREVKQLLSVEVNAEAE
jgi:thiol-disulfide isomerase/thioredoxin